MTGGGPSSPGSATRSIPAASTETGEGGPPLGAILAGGRSRRFGAPKALATVAGRSLVERARDALLRVVPEVVIVTAQPALYAGLHLPTRPDAWPGGGALSGLHTALLWARELRRAGVLLVACDMPFLHPGLLRTLIERGTAGQHLALAPQSTSRHGLEPLCAWYSTAALPLVEERLRRGERALHALLQALPAERLPLDEVRRFGDPDTLFLNVNTPDEHAHAERLAAAGKEPDAGV